MKTNCCLKNGGTPNFCRKKQCQERYEVAACLTDCLWIGKNIHLIFNASFFQGTSLQGGGYDRKTSNSFCLLLTRTLVVYLQLTHLLHYSDTLSSPLCPLAFFILGYTVTVYCLPTPPRHSPPHLPSESHQKSYNYYFISSCIRFTLLTAPLRKLAFVFTLLSAPLRKLVSWLLDFSALLHLHSSFLCHCW